MTFGYLLDTNVVSETFKRRGNPAVIRFFGSPEAATFYLSVLTIGELRKGAASQRAANPKSAHEIEAWIDATEATFADRILPIDRAIARRWGEASVGRSRPAVDTLIAATAFVHDLTLATRNLVDMRDMNVALFNPFDGRPT